METQIQSQTFNLRQRELFIKLLTQAKTRAEKEIESDYSFNGRVENEVIPKLAEEYGATDFLKKVQSLMKQLDDAKTALHKVGFDCDRDGDLSLEYEYAPKSLRDALDEAKRSAKQEREKGLKKYDLAIVAVLASEDVQEARKIVEGLL